jgi:hypothetical protein
MNLSDVFSACLTALCALVLLWGLLRGNPANDIDKSELVEACRGNTEAEGLVRSALQNPHLQRMDCFRLMKQIKFIQDSTRAKLTIETFLQQR